MLKLIIGTQNKCNEWLSGQNNYADYTNYWQSIGTNITKDIDKGDITGLEGAIESVTLFDIENMAEIKNNWLLFILDASGTEEKTINKIYFGGIITSKPRTLKGKDNSGKLINILNVMASGFSLLANFLKVDLPPMINQHADIIINKIMREFVDNNLIHKGTVNRPEQRLSVIRFNKERKPWSACRSIADLYTNREFVIIPTFTEEFIGGTYHFREKVKNYTDIILSDSLIEELGPDNSVVGDDSTELANIVTLPFYVEEPREPERFVQVTTDNEAELNSKFALAGLPANAERTIIYPGLFQSSRIDEVLSENDINNDNPPPDHTPDEGYLVSGDINGVYGLHFINPPTMSQDWGQIALVNNPVYTIFEPVKMTQLRAKELSISSLGNAIICAYYDNSSISAQITAVTSTKIFDVDDPIKFAINMLVNVNDEERAIEAIAGSRITLKADLSNLPEISNTCYVSEFNKSRIIFGLELKEDGHLYVVENGISTQIAGKTYTTDVYTIRNLCIVYETWTTAESNNQYITVNDPTGFNTNDIIETHHLGNNEDPTEVKVLGINSNIIQIDSDLGTIPANTRIRTKPKAKLDINGGTYGDVSGKSWTNLGIMQSTIQRDKDQIRELGFCIAMQKSLVGTLKEFKAALYPPVEVYIDLNWRKVNN